MKKTLLILLITIFLLGSVILIKAEQTPQDGKEWQIIDTTQGILYNSSALDNHEEDKERKIEPAPQPTLDLPSDRNLYLTIFSVSLILIFLTIIDKKKSERNKSSSLF